MPCAYVTSRPGMAARVFLCIKQHAIQGLNFLITKCYAWSHNWQLEKMVKQSKDVSQSVVFVWVIKW